MPELPEVERFRQILLPLVSKEKKIKIHLELSDNPPRKFLITQDDVKALSNKFYCIDILRKGKQIAMVLENSTADKKYLYVHMGMTGKITSPRCYFPLRIEGVKAKENSTFPPKYTYLTFRAGKYKAAFSDSRKFGSCEVSKDLSGLTKLAPDALTEATIEYVLPKLSSQNVGIKTIMLDQKRVVSGIGNWVADEVLYQSKIHPDQSCLKENQVQNLFSKLKHVLITAVNQLNKEEEFPVDWLFHYRWTQRRSGKDSKGREITFITSGGRTSAIVKQVQKLYEGQIKEAEKAALATKKKNKHPSKKEKKKNKRKKSLTSSRGNKTNSAVSHKKAKASQLDTNIILRRSPRFESKSL